MDGTLRKADAASEQINEPANPKHYWRYRFHLDIETLQDANILNDKIKNLIMNHTR
jgi:4-alpha-glucanotransferase